jgi:RND superfamily putative drug exporter
MSEDDRQPQVRGWTRAVTAHPVVTLLFALLVTALAAAAGSGVADRLSSGGWEAPDSQSSHATAALQRDFPDAQPNLILLVDARGGASVDTPAVATEGRALAHRLATDPAVSGVLSYWGTGRGGAGAAASAAPSASGGHLGPATLRSTDARQAMIAAHIRGGDDAVATAVKRLAPAYRGTHGPVRVRVGGSAAVHDQLQTFIKQDLARAEVIALPVTLVLLVTVFGSAVAALLPLGVGVVAIIGTNAVLRAITSFADVSIFAQNLTTALGLGLAVDYALFIVRRFREETAAGADPVHAVSTTLRTAGRTVLFSALTVAASLSAMFLFPQYFLRSFAYAGIAVVLLAAASALVILPACLVLLGPRVNALDLRRPLSRLLDRLRPGRAAARAAATTGTVADSTADTEPGARYARIARLVMRRAPVFAVVTVAGLVLLGTPFLRVQFGSADDRQLPASAESHVVQQDLRRDFPGNPDSQLTVLAEGRAGTGPGTAQLAAYSARVSRLAGVVSVDGPAGRFADGTRVAAPGPAEAAQAAHGAAFLTVQPRGAAVDPATQRLVKEVRAVPAPFRASTTGTAAVLVDTKAVIGDRLPWAAALIAAVTLLLVFLLTGSVLIPLQAIVLNALSLTAMFGAVVWVFQDGHLSGPLGFTATGTIETTLPVLMFCVAFGLSMDYGVFLLSRIKEEFDRTGDHREAVVFGVRRTGGLITAAAVILAVVMVAIGTSRIANTKMLGLGIALAVLMDAMVIRTLLVPAVMRLTGRATWWAPRPLRALHARFGLGEGEPTSPESAAGDPARDGSVPVRSG